MAIDHRIAAEMLLLYAEDLAHAGRAESLEALSSVYWSPRHDRLLATSRERAEALLDFALTDSPALVLALEGKSDIVLMRNTLELLGLASESGRVEFVDMKGVGGDVRLLARSRGIPRIDPEGYVGARVLRPLTAIMVAVDPEGPYTTRDGCEEQRQAMIDEIFESLPLASRTEVLREDLGHLIEVTTWGEAPLEYANFTDFEIADAIEDMALGGCPLARKDLESAVASHRAHTSNIERIWANWRIPEMSKPNLAAHLWPALRSKIEALGRDHADELPILRVAEDAIEKIIAVQGVRELRTKPD
jgi:hypothetical protein